jgi:hypothetical protein
MVKIVIFGKAEAGKSTFIRSIIPDAVNIEHQGRTIAFDFGTFNFDGTTLHFYGTPGQARFECIRDIVALSARMSILIFDNSRPLEDLDLQIVKEVKMLGTPFISVINRKATVSLLTMKDVTRVLSPLPLHIHCMEGDVRERGFCMDVLRRIIDNL